MTNGERLAVGMVCKFVSLGAVRLGTWARWELREAK